MINLDRNSSLVSEWLTNVLRNDIVGHTRAHVLAQNDTVGTSFEDIQIAGGVMLYLNTATSLDVTSADAADTSAGTGARTVMINGLDNDFKSLTETVTLNGVTPVSTTNAFRRINKVNVITAGSGFENAGLISIKSGSNIQASIAPTANSSTDGKLSVPVDEVAVEVYIEVDAGQGKEVDFRINAGNGEGVMRSSHVCKVFANTLVINLPSHIYDEKTDIRIQGKVSTGSAATIAMGHFMLIDKRLVSQTVFD